MNVSKKSGEVVIDLLSATLTQTRLDYKKLKESYERLLQDQRDYNHDLPAMNTENQELKRQLAEQNNSWNARRIRNELTAGIIQGESMGRKSGFFHSIFRNGDKMKKKMERNDGAIIKDNRNRRLLKRSILLILLLS